MDKMSGYRIHYMLDLNVLKQPGQSVPGRTTLPSTEGPAEHSVLVPIATRTLGPRGILSSYTVKKEVTAKIVYRLNQVF